MLLLFDSLNGMLLVLAIKFSFFLSKFEADEDELIEFVCVGSDEDAEDGNVELDADECSGLFIFDAGCCSVDKSVGFLNVNTRFIIFVLSLLDPPFPVDSNQYANST